jgi:putative colanic acid biosynthesis UDP-glucose lipid carrier transferase
MVLDLLLLNVYTWFFMEAVSSPFARIKSFWLAVCFAYLISIHFFPPVFHLRQSTRLFVIGRVIRIWTFFLIMSLCFLFFLHCVVLLKWRYWLVYYGLFFILLCTGHLLDRRLLLHYCKWKGLWHEVLFVGQGPSLEDLYAAMRDDVSYGYRLKGYFADAPKEDFLGGIPYLGRVSELDSWLDGYPGRISAVYCSLPSERADEIRQLMECCTRPCDTVLQCTERAQLSETEDEYGALW